MPGYKLQGRTEFQGLKIAIENKKGSIRRGVDENGEKWETKLTADYGYIVGTEGTDGDAVDCFIGENPASQLVFVMHTQNPETGKYDEERR
jgi:inorganic pyrophosphatase